MAWSTVFIQQGAVFVCLVFFVFFFYWDSSWALGLLGAGRQTHTLPTEPLILSRGQELCSR